MQQQPHTPPPQNLPQTTAPQNSGLAIASLICGIASFLFWFVGSLAAIICGHKALSRIKKSRNQISGKGMAIAGVICGYFTLGIGTIAMTAAILTPIIMHKKNVERAESDRQSAAELFVLLKRHETDHGTFPATLGELEAKGYISDLSRLQPQRGGNWHYYIGQSSKDDAKNLLLLSPDSDVALHIDGTTERLTGYNKYMHAKSRMKDYRSVQE